MKFKDLLLGTAAFTFAASTAFFACVLKKGHDFEESMDKTGNALDQCVICGGKNKIVGDVPMQDMKIGVFCGGMSVDLSQVKADKKQYDLDIEVRNDGSLPYGRYLRRYQPSRGRRHGRAHRLCRRLRRRPAF